MKLSAIQNTVQMVAEAISEAIGVETEIVSDEEIIVAGTGRYRDKIGSIEECGDSSTNEIYGMVLRTGVQYIIEDAPNHPDYWGAEGELAEVCSPIVPRREGHRHHRSGGIFGDPRKAIFWRKRKIAEFLR